MRYTDLFENTKATDQDWYIEIKVPKNQQDRFLRGQCFAFAIGLKKYIKGQINVDLPIYGMFDNKGQPHHAFLVNLEKKVAYDCRGEIPLNISAISAGSVIEASNIAPLSLKKIKEFVDVDLTNVKKEIPKWVYVGINVQFPDSR